MRDPLRPELEVQTTASATTKAGCPTKPPAGLTAVDLSLSREARSIDAQT